MTSVRVYTLLTPGQKSAMDDRAKKADRSVSYLIARAIDSFISRVTKPDLTKKVATVKVFARTSTEAADRVKSHASANACHDWQIVNAAVQSFIDEGN